VGKLESLTRGASVKGVLPECLVTVVDVNWIGTVAVELTYKDPSGKLGSELIYRDREVSLEIAESGRPWSFDGDGALFRLTSEANRIRLAYLFDPLLAVHTSLVDPLPHQIAAVYERMLVRQPLRFLLADDPGSGKTIMAGLLIKELFARGDLQRCLIVCPGSLVEQWQDELEKRFHLPFEIMTNDKLESARTGIRSNNCVASSRTRFIPIYVPLGALVVFVVVDVAAGGTGCQSALAAGLGHAAFGSDQAAKRFVPPTCAIRMGDRASG
jgi:hypothetical protein